MKQRRDRTLAASVLQCFGARPQSEPATSERRPYHGEFFACARSDGHLRVRAERRVGGGEAQARSVRRFGPVVRGRELGRHRPGRSDRCDPSRRGRELYAVAALAAAAVVVIGDTLQLPAAPVTAVAVILCFWLRVMAIRRGWRLPVAKFGDQNDSNVAEQNSEDSERS